MRRIEIGLTGKIDNLRVLQSALLISEEEVLYATIPSPEEATKILVRYATYTVQADEESRKQKARQYAYFSIQEEYTALDEASAGDFIPLKRVLRKRASNANPHRIKGSFWRETANRILDLTAIMPDLGTPITAPPALEFVKAWTESVDDSYFNRKNDIRLVRMGV